MRRFAFLYLGNRLEVSLHDFDTKYDEVIYHVDSVNGQEVKGQ